MKKKYKAYGLVTFFILFFFTGCSLTDKNDFEMQAKVHLDKLSVELKRVEDLKDLQAERRRLKKSFQQITDLMMAYHIFLEKHPELKTTPSDSLVLSAAQLKTELLRLIEIEGALDLLIEIQKDACLKLTLMEESLSQETILR